MRRWRGTSAAVLLACAAQACERKQGDPVAEPKPAPATSPPPAANPQPGGGAPSTTPAPPTVATPPKGEVVPLLKDLARWDAATTAERRDAAERALPLLSNFEFVGLETFSQGGATHEVALFRHATTGLEFSLIPGGTYAIGSPASEAGRGGDEVQQRATLEPFLIARTECTQAAWEAVMGRNDSRHRGPDLPAENMNGYEAQGFCSKAKLMLPTEAQWECACRAGTTTAYTTGDPPSSVSEHAWFDDPKGTTHPVGSKKPNAFGLHDVHGNVWEWCADMYGPRADGEVYEPFKEPSGAEQRVVRGGAYSTGAPAVRSAFRFRVHPGDKQPGLGLRPVRPVEWAARRTR